MIKQAPPEEFILTKADRLAIELGYYWDQAWVDWAFKIISLLRNPQNPQEKLILVPWQAKALKQLFGWRRPDGTRRFSIANVWLPKKNGKTLFMAVVSILFLVKDDEYDPGVFATSVTHNQATQLYGDAKKMLTGSPLELLIKKRDHRFKLELKHTPGVFQALAANADGVEGVRGSCIILDEIHVLLQVNPLIHDAMEYAGIGRNDPILVTISTAGNDRQGLPYEIWRQSLDITNNVSTELHTLAIVYAVFEDKAEYSDQELKQANPSCGHLFNFERLKEEYLRVKDNPRKFESFKRYRLNIWTKRSSAWLNIYNWDNCRSIFKAEDFAGEVAYAGVDLASTRDLCAAAIVIPTDDTYFIKSHFWLPKQGIESRVKSEMDFVQAAKDGWMTLCDDTEVSYKHVVNWLEEQAKLFNIQCIGYDPWKAAGLATDLSDNGLSVEDIAQGGKMSEPSYKFEALIEGRKLLHDGNPVLSWCVSNVEIRRDHNGKIRPVKPIEKNRRIDGVVASIMGLYLAMFPEDRDEDFDCG